MKTNPWKLSTMILAGALTLVVGTQMIPSASAENQPHMRAALNLLEQAHKELAAATADKGGHRVKAMEQTKAAIASTKAGIAYDNKH